MKPAFEDMSLQIPAVTAEPEDYTGEDGLLYCGKCRTPKEAYFPADKATLFGRDRHPAECDCQRAQRMEREAAEQQRKHRDKVEELKRRGFTDPAMREWTFANDNGRNPQMKTAHFYVEHWEDMKAGNIGYLLWGSVGTGKSYLAGCIANALMEKEISVRMTNFALILNDLAATFEGKNENNRRPCTSADWKSRSALHRFQGYASETRFVKVVFCESTSENAMGLPHFARAAALL